MRHRLPGVLPALFMIGMAVAPVAGAQEKIAPQAQPQQLHKPPFIEPAEMAHEKTALRAFIEAAPHVNGRWDTLPFMMPINPVHVALMHNGKVLVISGSGNDPANIA